MRPGYFFALSALGLGCVVFGCSANGSRENSHPNSNAKNSDLGGSPQGTTLETDTKSDAAGSGGSLAADRPWYGTASGSSDPLTVSDEPRGQTSNMVDVLFVVDNSVGMQSHQKVFVDSALRLVDRLLAPRCKGLDDTFADETGQCPDGSTPETTPIDDLHVGVITSSLGAQGSDACATEEANDRAYLLPLVREGVVDPDGTGYLAFQRGEDQSAFRNNVSEQILASGEVGCGFESPLEAAYRFLIDPVPPSGVRLDDSTYQSVGTGVDEDLLAKREQFLRDGSNVVVVMLTNEDDCSVSNGTAHYPNAGFGWLVTDTTRTFPVPSAACATDPSDECCHSCLQAPPEGCADTCEMPSETLPAEKDRGNVRCFDQKRRFGIDLLFPIERYVAGFSAPVIQATEEGTYFYNPLFIDDSGRWKRRRSQVFFSAIVGAPWQDLATAASLEEGSPLRFADATGLAAKNVPVDDTDYSRWDLLLGTPDTFEPAIDPFMVPSIAPRSGQHPLVAEAIVSPEDSGANHINGHEQATGTQAYDALPANDDLQYSCIIKLEEPMLDCTPEELQCACSDDPARNRPVCKESPAAQDEATTSQYFATAYPAPRILQVVRGLGEQGIPGSLCAKELDRQSPDFGDRASIEALLARLP